MNQKSLQVELPDIDFSKADNYWKGGYVSVLNLSKRQRFKGLLRKVKWILWNGSIHPADRPIAQIELKNRIFTFNF
jgi:hypothetical protein